MKGNEAIVRGAIAGGCRGFFGYPITPQNEIPEYMSALMPEIGGAFVQAESEVASINMVYGAASTGARVMTTSSSPGISLMQEGISYIATAELPAVIVNMQRGGPGLGNIAASQSDYFQAVKGGGHGDYKLLTLAPWSITECYNFAAMAFDLADKYRAPVMILADAIIGQMIEQIEVPEKVESHPVEKPWATNGCKGRKHNVINSLYIIPKDLEEINLKLQAKYALMAENEVRFEKTQTDDADLVVVAYGATARISKTAIDLARKEGLKVGLFRPVSLFPYPSAELLKMAEQGKKFLVVEMSHGQMLEDVKLSVNGKAEVSFYGRSGGMVPNPLEVLDKIRELLGKSNGSCGCGCCCGKTQKTEVSK
ncbi:MAG: 3-methyl-2-oxobutanoate dehydrogenase subunit VorB [Armatimonadota bacterium]